MENVNKYSEEQVEMLQQRLSNLEASPNMSDPNFRAEVVELQEYLNNVRGEVAEEEISETKQEIEELKAELANVKGRVEDIELDNAYSNVENNSTEDYNTLVYNAEDEYEEEDEAPKKSILSSILLILLGTALIAGLVFGIYKLFFSKSNDNDKNILNATDVFVSSNYKNGVEYGSGEVSSKELLDLNVYDGFEVTANPATIDTNSVGTKSIEYTISKGKKSNTIVKEFEVKDTILPTISGVKESLELEPNASFDLDEFIKSLKVGDDVEGSFDRVETEPTKTNGGYEKGWYTVKSNVNTKENSTYNITIHAVDKNGNEQDLVIPVRVGKTSTDTSNTNNSVNNNNSNNTSNNNSNSRNDNTSNNSTSNNTVKKKCQVKVVDKEAVKEVVEQVWVVDQPRQERITEQKWVETKPKVPAVTNTIYVVDIPADPERGIKEQGHTETVVIVPEVPAEGYYETVVVQEYRDEKGHWETKVVTPAQEEKYHYEERDC